MAAPCSPPVDVLSFRDAMVAYETLDKKWVITSPNMPWVPQSFEGRISVRRHADGHFGMHDPICWPQQVVQSTSFCWLVAVRRKPDDATHPLNPIWTPLSLQDDVVPAPNALHSAFCVVRESFRTVLQTLVTNQYERVKSFLGENPKSSREPEWLARCMRQAFERLSYPSTKRDLLCQVACVQRFWLLSDAWLEYYTHILSLYRFRDSIEQQRPSGVRVDLMGAFTTSSDVAAQLHELRIPLWFYRRSVHFTGDEVVLQTVSSAVHAPLISREFMGGPIYVGFAGESHIAAIAANSTRYVDIEHTPIPAHIGAVPAVVGHTPDTSRNASGSAQATQDRAAPGANHGLKKERPQPCAYNPLVQS